MHNDRMIIPEAIKKSVLEWVHTNYMHPGEIRMIKIIEKNMFWNNMHKQIKEFVKNCLDCAKNKKNPKQYAKLTPTNIHYKLARFECVAIDICGPWTTSVDKKTGLEYKYLLTIIDIQSRWCELISLTDHQGLTVCAELDNEWFCRYPRPNIVLSDQGPELIGMEFNELLQSYGVRHHYSTKYMPTANAIVERMHGTINQILRCIGMDDWHTKIPAIAFSLRASVHSALNMSPSDIVFGLDMVLPQLNANDGSWKDYSAFIKNNTVDNYLEKMNKSRIPHEYNPGDLVLVRKVARELTSKLDGAQDGLFKILEVHTNNTLTIDKHGLLERINLRRIIPWKKAQSSGRMS